MTQTLIEKLEKLTRYSVAGGSVKTVRDDDLRAIIEQAKSEAPQPDHTKLIGELVEALEKSNASMQGYRRELDYFVGHGGEQPCDAEINNNELLSKAREVIK